jgi:hypothetical protein
MSQTQCKSSKRQTGSFGAELSIVTKMWKMSELWLLGPNLHHLKNLAGPSDITTLSKIKTVWS